MENKQYLDEQKYQKIKKVLITIGCISIIIAIALIIIAITMKVPATGEEGWFEISSRRGILFFVSFIFGIMIPLPTLLTAFARDIAAFQAQQAMPVAQESIEKMSPTMGNAAKEIAKGVKEGLKDDE